MNGTHSSKGSYVYHEFGMKNTIGATWADVNLDGLEDLLYWDNSDGTYRPYFKSRKETVRSLLSLCPLLLIRRS